MNSFSDHDLMLAVRDGDIDKLGLLFERYHKQLYNFFLKQGCNPQTGEDLVQEVFFRILKYRHTYRGEGKFTTWMFSIARNANIDHHKKKHLEENDYEDDDIFISQDPNQEELTTHKDDVSILKKALGKLSPEKREIIILSRFQNMTYKEIGKILDIKVGTIKATVFRTLRELSKIYMDLAGEELK